MRVRVDEWNEEGPVLMLAWRTHWSVKRDVPPSLSFWEGTALRHPHIDECMVLEGSITDFVMLPAAFDGGQSWGIMWKPLFEAGIWDAACDHDPAALLQLSNMLKVARLTEG